MTLKILQQKDLMILNGVRTVESSIKRVLNDFELELVNNISDHKNSLKGNL